jgi:hypothetical protein
MGIRSAERLTGDAPTVLSPEERARLDDLHRRLVRRQKVEDRFSVFGQLKTLSFEDYLDPIIEWRKTQTG